MIQGEKRRLWQLKTSVQLWVAISCMAALFALAAGVGQPALAATLPQQAGESGEQLPSERLPIGAISRAHSFVVAYGGQSYFFNYEAGAVNVPFLDNVYKPFGFSHDSRLFLYLKSQGRFPGFSLYAHDVTTGAETAVSGSRQVHNAAWSPTGLEAAYIWLDTNGEFHLSLADLATTKTKEIAHGRIEPDYLEWSPAGDRLIYSTIVPQTTNFIHDRQFSSTLHVYNIQNGKSSEIKDAVTARFRGNDLLVVSSNPTKQYTTVENPQQDDIRDLAIVGDEIYTTIMEGDHPVTKHWNSQTRSFEKIEEGQIYRRTEAGIVVRNFGAGSVDYKYVTPSASPTEATSFRAVRKAATTSSTASAAPNWEMPYQGSAYLVQGGSYYSGGACDGRVCIITSHNQVLGYALDWQQVPTDGQGNTHILAIADGTVVGTQNSVNCNSNTGNQYTCPDYSSTCNDPSGGLGNYVSIAHSDGSYSFYGHLKYQSVQVTANQTVTQGTYIADQGHSGVAGTYNNYLGCGDHLHFQRQVSAAPWAQSIATDFAELPCVLTCTSAYVSANVENTPLSSSSLTVLLVPTTIVGVANSVANQVVLPSPAPAGGAVVSLSSSAPSLASVPASVTVPAGAVSAPFSISVSGVSSATSATIWASYGGNTANAVLTLQPVTISYLVLQASSVTGGATVNNNEVDLIGTAPANFAVTLSSSAAAATVPSSITVPSGANSTTFAINTSPVSTAVTSTIAATDGVNSFNRSLTVNPAFLSSVTLPSSTVGGNTVTGTVVLTGTTAQNFVVGLASSDPSVTVPSSVTVPAGSSTANFPVNTSVVSSPLQVTITATGPGGGTASAQMTVNPPAGPFTPIRVNAGATSGYTDPLSQLWSADTGYSGSGGMITSSGTVYGTNVPAIYQTGHWGYASSSQPLWYTFSVPNGTYTVNLKFDDPAFTQPGQRTFNVLINGQQVLSNFDIIAQAGGPYRSLDTPFTVNVTNGTIQIEFVAVLQNARICGIEIVAGTPAAPTLSSISPATISAGSSAAVTFTGTNLGSDVVVNAPAGINVSNVTVVNSTQLTGTVAVVSGEPSGTYNLSVTTVGGTSNPVSLTTK